MTQHDVNSGISSRARAHKGEIPDRVSCHVMRHGCDMTCEGCGRDLPVPTDEELATLPDLAPALCEEERVGLRRMARGGDGGNQ